MGPSTRACPYQGAPFAPGHLCPWAHPVLAPLSKGYPRLADRSPASYAPVRRSTQDPKVPFPHDLHVLSTPPAFALSQDQTLHLNSSLKDPSQGPLRTSLLTPSLHRQSRETASLAFKELPDHEFFSLARLSFEKGIPRRKILLVARF